LAAAVEGARGVGPAMDLLGIRVSDVETPGARAGESIALEQLTLKSIERLLREAMATIPDSAADSLLVPGGVDSLDARQRGVVGADSTATAEPVRGRGDGRTKIPVLAGASRAGRIEAESIVEVLYWKKQ
ncbi:MAG: hypothetical protein ACE5G2_07805, partial [Candidatus Krumholzibacteriia bacterium]